MASSIHYVSNIITVWGIHLPLVKKGLTVGRIRGDDSQVLRREFVDEFDHPNSVAGSHGNHVVSAGHGKQMDRASVSSNSVGHVGHTDLAKPAGLTNRAGLASHVVHQKKFR